MFIKSAAKEVFDYEINALQVTRDNIGEEFEEIIKVIVKCQGKIIVSGIGKSGHVARKISATFSSLGTPSCYLHPAEAKHGDLGMVCKEDVVILISNSGESEEVVGIISNIKYIGAKIIAITSNEKSVLAKSADYTQVLPKIEEACHLGLAPTSSTTVVLAYGDALAVVASRIYGFKNEDFGLFHPSGSLGKKVITTVGDLMIKNSEVPIVNYKSSLKETIVELSNKSLGFVNIVDDKNILMGIFTDGDLRRCIENELDIYSLFINDVMIVKPTTLSKEALAIDALRIMREKNINNAPVIDENGNVIGALTIQKIIDAGIIL